MNTRRILDEIAAGLTKDLVDRGRLIGAGFAAFAHFVIPKDAPPSQRSDMEIAFMAGAEHLWSSVMSFVDEGAEPTDKDMARMALVQRELDEWRAKISERMTPSQGRA